VSKTRPLPQELVTLAGTQRQVLTGAQLRSELPYHALRRALAEQQVIKMWHGAYCLPAAVMTAGELANIGYDSAPTRVGASRIRTVTRLTAAELTLSRPVTACLNTAAELWRFAIDDDHQTHVLGAGPSIRAELVLHRTPPLDRESRAYGFPVVGAPETAIRLAARADSPERSLAILDAALRSRFAPADLLCDAAGRLHIAGVERVRNLLPLADGRAESPGESWLRWMCHDAGFPVPVAQFEVTCRGGARYRIDLAWPHLRLGLEYDGVEFHTGKALTRDRTRLNALTRAGWPIQSVTAPMLWAGRTKLVAELRDDLRLRGAL